MAPPPCTFSLLLLLLFLTSFLFSLTAAQSAPGPAPSGPINVTAILEKAGNYKTFIRFLNETQLGNQINTQLNNSRDGMTVFAPTDNAFQNLPDGTLNNLTDQLQVRLILYHVCPKYYSLETLLTVSNPVRTLASGQDGGIYGLYFRGGQGSQVNVSTGVVDVPIYNAVRKDSPLAVYQVDKVLLPVEFTEAKAPAASPPPGDDGGAKSGSPGGDAATAPSTNNPGNGSGKMGAAGIGLVSSAISVLCMGLLMF